MSRLFPLPSQKEAVHSTPPTPTPLTSTPIKSGPPASLKSPTSPVCRHTEHSSPVCRHVDRSADKQLASADKQLASGESQLASGEPQLENQQGARQLPRPYPDHVSSTVCRKLEMLDEDTVELSDQKEDYNKMSAFNYLNTCLFVDWGKLILYDIGITAVERHFLEIVDTLICYNV